MNAMPDARFDRFRLALVTNHACNLRCTYCYTGDKAPRRLPLELGEAGLRRAARSVRPGGRLEVSFAGGEPLLDADLILALAAIARRETAAARQSLRLSLTTNGSVRGGWTADVLAMDDLDVAISFDGHPDVHDRHRLQRDGRPSSRIVLAAIDACVAAGRAFRVRMVVRPDTVAALTDGVAFLRARGVRQIDPALDLWTPWTAADGARLETALRDLAMLWREGLPEHGIGWFDETLLRLSGAPFDPAMRCGFGAGEIAVAPSGRLYPCERVVGEDRENAPLRLPGHVLDGADFLHPHRRTGRGAPACRSCAIGPFCGTGCACANFVRTGDPARADGLLCLLERVLAAEVGRTVRDMSRDPHHAPAPPVQKVLDIASPTCHNQ